MSDLQLSPAAEDLANSLMAAAPHPDYEPGKVGAFPVGAVLSGLSASGAAIFVEGFLADYAGPAAKAFISAEHGLIAQWLSPRIADLGVSILAEFGSKIGGDPSARRF